MLKWLQTLSRPKRLTLIIGFTLLGVLAFCLVIAGIANDGLNAFAKLFYTTEQKEVEDTRWKEFLKWAQEKQLGPEVINQIRDTFGDKYYVDIEVQNVLGFGFFVACMILLILISFIIVTSINYVSIALLKAQVHTAYREGLIADEIYYQLMSLFDLIGKKETKQNQETINQIRQRLENMKQLASQEEEQAQEQE
ncbi:hypothetical protein [Mycoplasma sp. 392]